MSHWTTHFLKANTLLAPYHDQIETAITRTQSRIGDLCPLHNLDIIVQVTPGKTIPQYGIVGHCYRNDLIFLSIDPTNSNFEKSLGMPLERIIAHEIHHAMRWQTVGYGETLGEALVTEGLAGHFVHEVFNSAPEPWECAVPLKDLHPHFKAAFTDFDDRDYSHVEWFFGAGYFPNWLGYSMGYELVRAYLKQHSNTPPSRLAAKPAKDFKATLQSLSETVS